LSFFKKLYKQIKKKNTRLCIGIDPDSEKLSKYFKPTIKNIEDFLKNFITVTSPYVVCYKANIAFFEVLGYKGWELLEKLREFIPVNIPFILDAKRGDIKNTSKIYSKVVFEVVKADAVTVNPYMGMESLEPFLDYKDKGIYILCLTSNPGSDDFQKPNLFKKVAIYAERANKNKNIGLVVGATQNELEEIRNMVKLPFLIPGIGSQGGNVNKVKSIFSKDVPDIVNVSRKIMYVKDEDYLKGIEKAAKEYSYLLKG